MDIRDLTLRNYDCQVTIKPSSGNPLTWTEALVSFVKGKCTVMQPVITHSELTPHDPYSKRLTAPSNHSVVWPRNESISGRFAHQNCSHDQYFLNLVFPGHFVALADQEYQIVFFMG
jgi:hypothetical protein